MGYSSTVVLQHLKNISDRRRLYCSAVALLLDESGCMTKHLGRIREIVSRVRVVKIWVGRRNGRIFTRLDRCLFCLSRSHASLVIINEIYQALRIFK
jgi:hypothetical protein